jgi:hypothetical protein
MSVIDDKETFPKSGEWKSLFLSSNSRRPRICPSFSQIIIIATRRVYDMADLDFQSFFDWESEIRGNYPEAPKFTEKDARVEWSHVCRKREYLDILDALEDSLEEITEYEKRIGDFSQNAKQAGLTERDRYRRREGLAQAALQSFCNLREHLRQFTVLLIHTNKHDIVDSREWSQRYAGEMMEATRRAIDDYQNIIERCQAARKRLGSLGAPVEPLPDPFDDGDGDGEMEETYDEDIDMAEGAASDDGWVYDRELSEGSFGQVSLWVRYDEAGKVVERCASKEVPVEHERNQMRREAFMHSLISAKDPNGRYIVVYRGDEYCHDDRVHRLYLEVCPYGDLFDVKKRMFDRKDKA